VNGVARRNGSHGIALDENAAGDLTGRLARATASNNQGAGVAAEQAGPGTGELRLRALTAEANTGGAVFTMPEW
jgi:hypothetical protein